MTWMEKLERHRSLKDVTTFGVGGPAEYFIEVLDIPTMRDVLVFCKDKELPYLILGKGSNILFHEKGFAGMVILNRIQFLKKIDLTTWHVGAGYSFSLLGSQTARQGLGGLEFASGIPGSVGGAIFMNAGANGTETSHPLHSVDFITPHGEIVCFQKEELLFDYRFSSFQNMKGAIVAATFSLINSKEARQRQLEIIHYRKKTQPYDAKSAGCVFRNPNCQHAGALIEKCGLKGKSMGGAQVSHLHANFIINKSDATSSDILNLIAYIRHDVKSKTGIDLESEVQCIPYYQNNAENIT